MIEQKSRGVDLNKAYTQVSGYYDKLNANEKPRYIVLSNFDELWLYDIANPLDIKTYQCPLSDLPSNAEWLSFYHLIANKATSSKKIRLTAKPLKISLDYTKPLSKMGSILTTWHYF